MFIGEFSHNIDSKNRIILPAKFREALGDCFIITKGLDGCLYVFPKDEWEVFEKKLKSLPLTSKDARAFVRFFFSGACEAIIDKQGRTVIPQNLLEYAKIEKEVVTIGVSNRVEIWSKTQWDGYNEAEINMDEIAGKMLELGI
ncbi:MAG: division/cell wall cluster transcriptional repressor MraZ [Clostridiaceae bacterium]